MDKPPFEVTVEERIAHLRLCRPESFNAMSFAGIVQLGEAVRALAADARIRCLLLSSTGKHFTSGMQLDEFREGGLRCRWRPRATDPGSRPIWHG